MYDVIVGGRSKTKYLLFRLTTLVALQTYVELGMDVEAAFRLPSAFLL
jgi:hypothetical protein